MEPAWLLDAGEPVQVIATERLWGASVATVVIPSTGTVDRVATSRLLPIADRTWTPSEVAWRAATGLIRRAAAEGQIIAVARNRVEALPHQLAVVQRAMSTQPLRLLLADEVGLGKTIEAGLIISELKARRRIRRILIVAPKGVQLQWLAEMSDRFEERFVIVGPGGVPLDASINPWETFDQVICSLDAVKPLRARAGWSPERVAAHNDRRVHAMVDAGWDLVIIDEAHHVSGSGADVARHQLARLLAAAVPSVLALTATPHSGKSEAFVRLLGLLDDRFTHGQPLSRTTVSPLVVRTEKRRAINAAGQPLFRPRATMLVTVPYGSRTVERHLYDAVTDYVRHGYRRAVNDGRPVVGFLVLLMQRLVSSSTAAIHASLERRLAAITEETQQLSLPFDRSADWADLSGEEQQAAMAESRGAAWVGERREVEHLLALARQAASGGIDAKARYLLDLLSRIARHEGDPAAKTVVFTEFVPTQVMLLDLLAGAGVDAAAIDGSMTIAERRDAQELFASTARVLVSTDAGSEGVNLQFAHTVVNYDLPWSPTRIEQRIGRVDRIGQTATVVAHNLVLESSVDARVLEVLEAKLAVILSELGVDKTADVLATTGIELDELYTTAILTPERLYAATEVVSRQISDTLSASSPLRDIMGDESCTLAASGPAVLSRWLEAADRGRTRSDSCDAKVTYELPEVLAGEPVPCLEAPEAGWWSMWETGAGEDRSMLALFRTDRGSVRPDLAERIWTRLADCEAVPTTAVLDAGTFASLHALAVDHGYRRTDAAAPALTLRLAARTQP